MRAILSRFGRWLWPFFLLPLAHGADHPVVAQLLAQPQAPPGVVFEIATGDPAALAWAVPQVADYARRLRSRFPGLDMAVVSHGREMFALQQDRRAVAAGVHGAVEQLAREQHIPVHVCGTYANWRGVAEEAFPDYVNVAPEGPAQVRAYQALGYVVVRVDRPAAETTPPARVE